ncbi:DinB family protein [Stackebrandtia soli]|uniref:DinB family protein n=1 Tax=Stackebrandtia soli TaxID=1892856 RepID=UPI0039EC2E83
MSENDVMRFEPPLAGNEIEAVLGSLERLRATFAWKCGGLDADSMNRTVGASTMTLGGLVKHLAAVESIHFSRVFDTRPGMPWEAVDWDADPDWPWHSAVGDTPEELMTLWLEATDRSRGVVAKALVEGGMDLLSVPRGPSGASVNLRRVLMDLVEEYGRHVGHADLIRESVDGLVGEDPPG